MVVELLLRERVDALQLVGGRVVDDDVESAASVEHRADRCPRRARLCQVGGHRERLAPRGRDLVCHSIEKFTPPPDERNGEPSLGEGPRGRGSDAGTAAGDHRHTPVQAVRQYYDPCG